MVPAFSYVKAKTVKEAVKELSQKEARVYSGGSDLMGCLRDEVFAADKVVSLSGIPELNGVNKDADGGMRIGAMTHVSELAANEEIARDYPALSAALKVIASPQLRNQGTLGGNICQRPRCWYYRGDFDCAKKGGDMCYAFQGENTYHAIFGGDPCYIVHPSDSAPALIAHGAKVTINGPTGARKIKLEDFFVLPADDLYKENVLKDNEIVTHIHLPPAAANVFGTYNKIRTRESWDFAIVSAAVVLRMTGSTIDKARVVLGGVAPKPWRVNKAEKAAEGKPLNMETAKLVAEAALEGADPLEHNGYKINMAKGAVIDAILSLK
jgi:xanthine dehydrogenase YagS FAD-binding subunit